MKLYNTLSRRIENFSPINDRTVKLYSCGPTVYDFMHIGNLRKFVFDDTLRRALGAAGYDIKHVVNITDVGHLVSDADEGEDKLEKGAEREKKTVSEVSDYYSEAFKSDIQKLNILTPNGYQGRKDNYARATDFIDQQQAIIKQLIDKDFAYQAKQAIYFDIAKLKSYAELTGQKLSEKELAVRPEVVTDTAKRQPADFSLWFFTTGHFAKHSLHWPSPWGEGFPGWHLECSAIIHATLGDPIDIHTGGVDNIGTHHVNEMAQTEAAYGHRLANYWLHCEHLLVDGQKMSKSLGNYYRLADVEAKGFDPLALRLLFLQAHYRSQLNFTWESLEAASKNLASLRAFADLRFQAHPNAALIGDDYFKENKKSILNDLTNDLATPSALAKLDGVIDYVSESGLHPTRTLNHLYKFLTFLDEVFGLNLLKSQDIGHEQKALIEQREAARQSQDWPEADKLRNQLRTSGLELNDTEHGPIWYRI